MTRRSHRVATGAAYVWLPDPEPMGDWVDQAACRDADVVTFFPLVGARTTYVTAVAICRDCPVRLACLDYAVTNRIRFGVWGGLSVDRRRKLAGPGGHVRRPMPAHGASRYHKGCRCGECREAHRVETRRYREAVAERETS